MNDKKRSKKDTTIICRKGRQLIGMNDGEYHLYSWGGWSITPHPSLDPKISYNKYSTQADSDSKRTEVVQKWSVLK